jgi:hypothetical protein
MSPVDTIASVLEAANRNRVVLDWNISHTLQYGHYNGAMKTWSATASRAALK